MAYLGHRLHAALWLAWGDLFAVVAWTTGLTVLFAYVTYRVETAQILVQLDATELPDSAPDIQIPVRLKI